MKFTPLRISLIYFIIAIIWITTSDYIVDLWFDSTELLSVLQTIKGFLFVSLTAILLYSMIKSYERFISKNVQELEQQKKRLDIALDSANMTTWEYDTDRDIYISTKRHHEMFGYPAGETLTLQKILNRVYYKDIKEFEKKAEQSRKGGKPFDHQYRIQLPSGKVYWYWTKAEVKPDTDLNIFNGVTMDITKRKELEEELQIERERLSKLFDRIPVLINIYNSEREVTSINSYHEHILGWTQQDIKDSSLLELCYPDPTYRKKVISDIIKQKKGWSEYHVTTKSGEERLQMWTNFQLSDDTFVGVGYDVTEQRMLEKQIKEEREQLRLIFDSMPLFINIHDKNNNISEVNKYFEKRFGYSNKDLKHHNLLELITTSENYPVAKQAIEKSNGTWNDFELITKSGQTLYTTWINISLSEDRSLGIGLDISERKRMEETMREKEERLSLAVKGGRVGLWDWRVQNGELVIDEEWAKQLGYTVEELSPVSYKKWEELTHPDDKEKTLEIFEEYFQGDRSFYENTIRMKHKDGHWVYILDRGKVVSWIDDTTPERILGTHLDISERIELEKSIKESRERLQVTTNSANIGLWEWNPKTGEIYIDQIWASLVGYTLDELEPISIETWNTLLHPDDLDLFNNTVEKYFSGETDTYECEVRMKHKKGHWVWILDRGKIIERDEEGNPTKMTGTHVDITDRVEAEQENKVLANVYRFSNTALGVSNHKTGELVRVNSAFAELLDYEIDELIGKKVTDIYAPGSQQDITRVINELTEYGQTIYETTLQQKNGDTFQALVNLALLTDEDNHTQYRLSTVQDISYIKEQQAELQRSRDRLLQAQEIAKLGYWTLDVDENELWWSEIVYDIYGKQIDNYTPAIKNYLKLTHPDDRDSVRKVLKNELLNKSFESIHRIIRDGQIGYVQLRGERFYDEIDKKWLINGTVLDITEIKQIEKQLETQQKRFEIAANITSDVIWEWDPEKEQLWWGDGIETLLGYDESDYKNDPRFWHRRIAKKDQERIIRSMEEAEMSGALYWNEKYSFLDVNNQEKQIDDSAMLVRDKDGNIVRIIGAMVDKTKEIEYQKSLEHQSRKFEMIAKSSNDVLYEWNCKTDKVWWSEGWQTKFMFDEKQVENTYDWWKSRLHPDYKEKIIETLERSMSEEAESWHEYYKFKNGKGSYSIVIDKGYFIKEEGDVTYMVGTISDITEEVNAREELKASEEQYRLLFEQNPIPMWIYDPNTLRFVTVNQSALKKYGYSEKEMLNMTIADIRPESDLSRLKKDLDENLGKDKTEFKEWEHLTKSGKSLIVEISASNIFYKGKRQRLVIAHDITEQRRAEEKAISAIIEGEERERQRIAKELHDGLGQYLSASNMNLKSVYEDIEDIPDKLDKSFKTGLELLNHAISETRNISQNLLPKAIQDYGLELAVESLLNQLKNNSSISIKLYKNLTGASIPNNIQINLYRILQEALNNAIRHGRPDKIDVQLVYSENELLLVIEDNGIGFDIQNVSGDGVGLRSMKTRAGAMSAEFDIVSSKDKGTIISVIVPI
jgi:PAS domain S-box-containing protein